MDDGQTATTDAKDAKSQLIETLKNANNLLVTVSRDPSVDQLSALIGLTLFLNKQNKHAAAVFSGEVPSTLEFLQPDSTIEKNTDSLRDFIIALDKAKADKLRYKVEDNVVRIFITPYKTSITQDDLEFSQGDFNVDVVVAIGVHDQGDIDDAITAHGRILHDATITSVNTVADGDIGSINWHDSNSSSLSEMVTELVEGLDGSLMDNQIATALLTGIVAETARFSNDKTSSHTMSMSAMLMAAGANQQLVASKLEEGEHSRENGEGDQPHEDAGTLEINHPEGEGSDQPAEEPTGQNPEGDNNSDNSDSSENNEEPAEGLNSGRMAISPQTGGVLTASTQDGGNAAPFNPMNPGDVGSGSAVPLLSHDAGPSPMPAVPLTDVGFAPTPQAVLDDSPVQPHETLSEIETAVDSPHSAPAPDSLEAILNQNDAGAGQSLAPTPVAGSPFGNPVSALPDPTPPAGDDSVPNPTLTPPEAASADATSVSPFGATVTPLGAPAAPGMPTDQPPAGPLAQPVEPTTPSTDGTTPPPVPPPIPFQFGGPSNPPTQ
ncbi:MAG TPA: hypothetical protein VG604_02685 [Candidatus Saccharimonadales bacterium]|nr:hypothetical protein [Candidatus Saccharimonadales bacterium]